MADENSIVVGVKLDTGDVKFEFKKVEANAKEAGKSIGQNLTDGVRNTTANFLGNIKTQLLAIGASIAGGFAFTKAIDEAKKAEQATTMFSQSLANLGVYSRGAVESFDAFAQGLQRTTGIQDDVIKQNASLLVNLGKLSGEGLERATKASIDLATALQMDTGTAFNLVAKAASGNVAALSRYGIKIDESLPKTQQLAAVLSQLEKRFGGAGAQNLNTFTGAMTALSLSIDEVFKNFGKLFTQSPVIRAVIKFLIEQFQTFADKLAALSKSGDFIGNIVKKLLEVSKVLIDYILRPIEVIFNALKTLFYTVVALAQTAIMIITNLGGSIVALFVKISEGIGILGAKVVGLFNEKLGKELEAGAKEASASIISVLQTGAQSTSEVMSEAWTDVGKSAGVGLSTGLSESLYGFTDKMLVAAETAKAIKTDLKNNMEAPINPAWTYDVTSSISDMVTGFKNAAVSLTETREVMSKNFKEIGKAALTSFAGAVGNSFAAFGKALQKGEDAAQAFANAFLGAIGGMLVQLGTSYILQGIAASANPLTPGIGGPLIAAGAALATFGGILQSMGGGGGGGAEAGGGVAAEPATPTTEITPAQELQPTAPGTAVVVNVQGNILDRRQTGLELAEVIRESFETQGAVAVQGAFA